MATIITTQALDSNDIAYISQTNKGVAQDSDIAKGSNYMLACRLSTLATFVNKASQTGPVNNTAISTSGTQTSFLGSVSSTSTTATNVFVNLTVGDSSGNGKLTMRAPAEATNTLTAWKGITLTGTNYDTPSTGSVIDATGVTSNVTLFTSSLNNFITYNRTNQYLYFGTQNNSTSSWDAKLTINFQDGSIINANSGTISGFTKVYNAIWNDYADFIAYEEDGEPGYCYVKDGDKIRKSQKKAEKATVGICTDTYGYITGTNDGKHGIAIAVSGFVLAHVDKKYSVGTPLVSAPNGMLTKAGFINKLFHHERIVGWYYKDEKSETYHDIVVNGRNWVRIV